MPRHKMRKANAALNKGQMVRLINERVVYVPPPLGRCCRYTDADVLIGCSDVTEEECCCSQNNEDCELGYSDCGYAVWNGNLDCTTACSQDEGACCVDGACSEQTPQDCEALGGFFFGVNELCADNVNCSDCNTPEACCPTGRCCVDGGCAEGVRQCECLNAGGNWIENGACPTNPCESDDAECVENPEVLCCKDGTCLGRISQCECQAQGGISKTNGACPECTGSGSDDPVCCPSPEFGACCDSDFNCSEVFQGECDTVNGSTFYPGSGCADIECTAPPPKGRCCERCPQPPLCGVQLPRVNGVYSFTTEAQCNGTWSDIDNDDCPPCPDCPDPPPPEELGRCCSGSGRCSVTTQANCLGVSWRAGSNCIDPFTGRRIRCSTDGGGPCLCDCEYSGVPEFSNVIVFCSSFVPTGNILIDTPCSFPGGPTDDCSVGGCPSINVNDPWCVPQGFPTTP